MNPLLNEYQYTLNIKPEYYPDWNLMNPNGIQNEASVITLAAINILAVVYSINIEMIQSQSLLKTSIFLRRIFKDNYRKILIIWIGVTIL